jgi:FAD/FMN-containing dehydrogenase/Fe-S oxidoreductase
MNFEEELRHSFEGEMRFDEVSRRAYSVDASIYEIEPLAIVIPRTKQDIVTAVAIARKHGIAIIPRGAATGISGGCLGRGMVIDLSKFLNRILHIDVEEGHVICEPGVVQDQLNRALAKHRLRLGPDTSTGNRATLGGMVANNAAGSRSLRYGRMVDAVIEVEMLLANGDLVRFGSVTEAQLAEKCALQSTEGYLYREVWRISQQYRHQITKHFPKLPRRVSGYNLDELIKEGPLNIAKLIVGSEGTLGVITEIKVSLAPCPRTTGICAVYFHDLLSSMEPVPFFLTFQPMAIELIDGHIIEMGRLAPSMRGKLEWLQGAPGALVLVEFEGTSEDEVQQKMFQFEEAVRNRKIGYACVKMGTFREQECAWALRKAGLGLLLSKRSYSRAVAFIEDISIPPEKLAPFMEQFIACLKRFGKEAGIYGHIGSGCMHIRPYMDLRDENELTTMREIMLAVADLISAFGGALSGEHGDGLVRSWLNKKMFGDTINHAFVELKRAFDPSNQMNPGKIVHPHPFLDDLRAGPKNSIDTFLDFRKEGGFELAVDLCNGNGLCRKKEGVMCPSFQATNDEYDTTRARAQALRAVVNGRLKVEDLAGQAVHDVLDLCLQCKGCKTECPSQVDMAKMKVETLFHYQEKHGYSVRNRLFARIGRMSHFGARFPSLYNALISSRLTRWAMARFGIAAERSLPQLAKTRFSKWFESVEKGNGKRIVLFNDTYTEFYHHEIGKAAVKLLKALGYEIILPAWHCCGRPQLSKGMLPEAKKLAQEVVETLYPYAAEGIPIVGLEPSCILTLSDDYPSLLGADDPKLLSVIKQCCTFDQFLDRLREAGELHLNFVVHKEPVMVKVHGHCYEKALVGTQPLLRVLRMVPHFRVEEIPSGCCGVAGSFGYEKEHYPLSMRIGELKLLPAVRQAAEGTLFVANGMSCRSQIHHGTGREARHFVEILADQVERDH